MVITVKFKRLALHATFPTSAYAAAAGLDLYSCEEATVPAGESHIVRVGWAMELPKGWYGILVARSSMSKQNLLVLPGVIDEDYRGEIGPRILNLGKRAMCFPVGVKVAQLLVYSRQEVSWELAEGNELTPTTRGTKGFGSSDKMRVWGEG